MVKFEDYVKKYNNLIYDFVNKTYVDGYDNNDLYQECLMVLDSALKDYKDDLGVKFSTYLYVRLRNRMYDLIRSSRKLVLVDNNDTLIDTIESHYSDYTEINDKNNENLMKHIVNILTDEIDRGYITLLIVNDGLTQKEIADLEGISQQRVAYLHKRNIKALRKKLKITQFKGDWGL